MPLLEPSWSSWGDLPVFYYTQRNPLPFAQYSTRAMFVSSMSCGKHLQEAVDEPFQHTAMPKCFLNPNYPIIFTFSQSQTKIHHLNVCNQNSFKSFQEAVDEPFYISSILGHQKASSTPFLYCLDLLLSTQQEICSLVPWAVASYRKQCRSHSSILSCQNAS